MSSAPSAAQTEPSHRLAAPELLHTTLLGEVFQHASLAVLVHDDDGNLVAVNRAACKLTGYERDELLSLAAFDLVIDASSSSTHGSVAIRRRDGRRRRVGFRTAQTSIAGMPYIVTVYWDESRAAKR